MESDWLERLFELFPSGPKYLTDERAEAVLWDGVPVVRREASKLTRFTFGSFVRGGGYYAWFLETLSKCGSPIEKLFVSALVLDALESMFSVVGLWSSDLEAPFSLEIVPQAKIESFRVDFLLRFTDPSTKFHAEYVIECDGHAFHERTKEQAAADRSRDRRLQQLGYRINRYTGSEIWREAQELVSDLTYDLSKRAAEAAR